MRKESLNKEAAWDNARRLKMVADLRTHNQLNIQKICEYLWKLQEDDETVVVLSDLLTSEGSSKSVFDGIEFFLPQLTHMMMHLDPDWPHPILEQFVYMVAQQSLHFALQLHWLLLAQLQQYAPELDNGNSNPAADHELLKNCARILKRLEIVITYGNKDADLLEQDYFNQKITKEEYDEAKKETRFAFGGILASQNEEPILNQTMFTKRTTKDKKELVPSKWKELLVTFKDNMLYITDPAEKKYKLRRAIYLTGSEVEEVTDHKKHENYFKIMPRNSKFEYHFRPANRTRKIKWLRFMRQVANEPPSYDDPEEEKEVKLTDKQRARWSFYRSQLNFVDSLSQICDSMMEIKDKKERVAELPKLVGDLQIDELNYNPMCKSTDKFSQIIEPIPEASFPFSTKGHCPCLLAFRTKTLNHSQDVANVLNDEFSEEAATGILSNIASALAPMASLIVGEEGAQNMLITRPNLWEGEDDIITLSRMQLPLVPNELRVIAKNGDDMRQEAFAMQIISFLKDQWEEDNLDLFLYPFQILPTSRYTGLVEVVPNCMSLDALKKKHKEENKSDITLMEHFEKTFKKKDLPAAQRRFAESLAGYSVASYILGIKNRNNTNIMLSTEGHIIHVDFGHILGMAPGNNLNPEKAAFKFTKEMVEVLGGEDSALYQDFVKMCVDGFISARAEFEAIKNLSEIMAHKSHLPCFNQKGGSEKVIKQLMSRFMVDIPEAEAREKFRTQIDKSKNHVGTRMYDKYQNVSQRVL